MLAPNRPSRKPDFSKAYKNHPSSKKLYYFTPEFVRTKHRVLDLWRSCVVFDALEFEFPILVPESILDLSGHKIQFGPELFKVENEALCLRPEAAISVFDHMKELKSIYGTKSGLAVAQYGKSFRNEKTTRDRHYRLRQFEQMEVEILQDATADDTLFFDRYDLRLKQFFNQLGLVVYSREVDKSELPHYSRRTVDYFVTEPESGESIQVGCLSNRGDHDLKDVKNFQGHKIFECSLGLTRIILLVLAVSELVSCVVKPFN